MTDGIEERADKLVQVFKESLTTDAQASLTSADYERLKAILKNAISETREETAKQVEELARRMRSEIEHPDLDL